LKPEASPPPFFATGSGDVLPFFQTTRGWLQPDGTYKSAVRQDELQRDFQQELMAKYQSPRVREQPASASLLSAGRKKGDAAMAPIPCRPTVKKA